MIAILELENHGVHSFVAVTIPDPARIHAPANVEAINEAAGANRIVQLTYPKQAISIRQPWGWAIMNAGKDVENRTRKLCSPGWYFLHVGSGGDIDEYNAAVLNFGFPHIREVPRFDELPRGGVIGAMKLGEWITESPSKWFIGPKAAKIEAVVALPFQAGRGAQGVFAWDHDRAF